MGKREKNLKAAKAHREEEENEEPQLNPANSVVVPIDSSDDEEANEDLSLKIVEKAMQRACSDEQRGCGSDIHPLGPIDLSLSPSQEAGALTADVKSKKKCRKEKKKAKNNKVENPEETVVAAKEVLKTESTTTMVADNFAETNSVETSDNIVLRKLLRGPRYFDPPDSGWGTCYNCGEEGHASVNCTSAKRKKPCFFCGGLDHVAKQCTKGQDCFICKKGGHRAKDCPEKYKKGLDNAKICLKCGETGHDMFSCNNDYSPDELKAIQCYICKSFGHLCCADFTDSGARKLSCYRCGHLGHSGLGCKRVRTDITSDGSPRSCYKCGEAGHFARECTNKVRKRNLDPSTPTLKKSKQKGDRVRVQSAPTDVVKAHKRKKYKFEDGRFNTPSNSKRRGGWVTEDPGDLPHGKFAATDVVKSRERKIGKFGDGGFSTPYNSKWRGGWITEDPEDLPRGKGKARGQGSPITLANKRKNDYYTPVAGGHASSYSSKKTQKVNFASASNGGNIYYTPVAGGYASASYPLWNAQNVNFGASASNGGNIYYTPVADGHALASYAPSSQNVKFGASASNGHSNIYQHRYSASRFGDNSNDWMRRNYDW